MNAGTSMIETLRDFVAKSQTLGIEYMVTGSFAMSAYGEVRMTRDIDIVVQIEPEQADEFARLFQEDYYVSVGSIKSAIAQRSMFNVISQTHGGKLDCIMLKDTDFARSSFHRRYRVTVSGIEFWTTTKEDLILAKLNWARDTFSEMQIRDIANLTSSEYDAGYVANWIELGFTEHLVRGRAMEDTTRKNRQLVYDIVMSKSVEERFLMCAEMYEDAKALATIGMPQGLSDKQQKDYVFKRLHGADPDEFVETEWLNIVYSGFWDFPFGFVVRFEGEVYFFRRGGFDEVLDDYPSEYEVVRDNSIDMSSVRPNFGIETEAEVLGRIDMRDIVFDPSHRQRIDSNVFKKLGIKKIGKNS